MSKPPSTMTVPEQWDWHAEMYAFRRVVLGLDEPTSPCDAEGKWFHPQLIDEAAKRLRDKRTVAVEARRHAGNEAMEREAVRVKDRWARDRGYRDCADYQERERLDRIDAASNIARSFLAMAEARNREAFSEPAALDRAEALRDLGVTAREYKPTPEQLRAGRIALGLEAAEPEPGE